MTEVSGKFSPSRDTAGRRRRELRARARDHSPDSSEIIFEYGDGWTIRRIHTLEDQRREGALMRHCLRTVTKPDPNAWSLRDPHNLPHLTFSVWRVDPADKLLDDLPLLPRWFHLQLFRAGDGLFLIDVSSRSLKHERRLQLVEFGERGPLWGCDRFNLSALGPTLLPR